MNAVHERAVQKIVSARKSWDQKYSQDTNYGTDGNCCKHGYVLKEGVKPHWGSETDFVWPCHSRMKYPKDGTIESCYSVWCEPPTKQVPTEVSSNYFNWLVSPESPWFSLFEKAKPIVTKDHDTFTSDFQRNYGFVFYNLDEIPANLMMNFFVATRMLKEWPDDIKRWDSWVREYKISKDVAFLFLQIFNSSMTSLSVADKYDWPLDTGSCTKEYASNFVNHKIDFLTEAYGIDTDCYWEATNRIWGKNAMHDKIPVGGKGSYLKFLFDTYSPVYGKVNESKSKFEPQTGLGTWHFTKDDAVKIMKAEEERLNA